MQTLIEGLGLGLIGGVIPGSILTILLVSVIQGGFRAGLRAFFWSLAAELTVVGVLLAILFTLPIPPQVFNYIGIVGSLVLFYFSWQIFHLKKIEGPQNDGAVFSGRQIYTLAATNAPLYIFWTTVCAPLIWKLSSAWPTFIATSSFMLAFEIGWSASTFVIMLLFVYGRRYLTDEKIMKRVYVGAAVLMSLLGMRMLFVSLSLLGVI